MCNWIFIILAIVVIHEEGWGQEGCGLIINEILFNPAKDGFDYVELINNSDSVRDLKDISIANRNATGDIASVKFLSKESFLVGPFKHVVITANEKWLRQNYLMDDSVEVCNISSLPSFPDDEGTVVIMRKLDSVVCDEVSYSEKWHFGLLDNPSGISLERLSASGGSNNRHNWTSASSASHFGTPGYRNSQSMITPEIQTGWTVYPKIFTPDNDGIDDYMSVEVNGSFIGYVINSKIFDVSGREVRYFLKNENLGTTNIFRWDGLDDERRRLTPGAYIVVSHVFDTNGNVKKFKNVVVIGNRRQ